MEDNATKDKQLFKIRWTEASRLARRVAFLGFVTALGACSTTPTYQHTPNTPLPGQQPPITETTNRLDTINEFGVTVEHMKRWSGVSNLLLLSKQDLLDPQLARKVQNFTNSLYHHLEQKDLSHSAHYILQHDKRNVTDLVIDALSKGSISTSIIGAMGEENEGCIISIGDPNSGIESYISMTTKINPDLIRPPLASLEKFKLLVLIHEARHCQILRDQMFGVGNEDIATLHEELKADRAALDILNDMDDAQDLTYLLASWRAVGSLIGAYKSFDHATSLGVLDQSLTAQELYDTAQKTAHMVYGQLLESFHLSWQDLPTKHVWNEITRLLPIDEYPELLALADTHQTTEERITALYAMDDPELTDRLNFAVAQVALWGDQLVQHRQHNMPLQADILQIRLLSDAVTDLLQKDDLPDLVKKSLKLYESGIDQLAPGAAGRLGLAANKAPLKSSKPLKYGA